MGRRINTLPDEKPVNDEITDNTQENDVRPAEEIVENKDNLSNEPAEEIVEEPVKETVNDIVKGDRVKIDPTLSNDMLGRRIHNGLKNYTYTVLNVRSDGFCSVECLTHVFCVHKKHLTKI